MVQGFRVLGVLGFRALGLGFRVLGLGGLGSGLRIKGLGFRVFQGLHRGFGIGLFFGIEVFYESFGL